VQTVYQLPSATLSKYLDPQSRGHSLEDQENQENQENQEDQGLDVFMLRGFLSVFHMERRGYQAPPLRHSSSHQEV